MSASLDFYHPREDLLEMDVPLSVNENKFPTDPSHKSDCNILQSHCKKLEFISA